MSSLSVESLYSKSFSFSLPQINIEDRNYYPIYSLSSILGYSNPNALLSLIDKQYLFSMDELYCFYSLSLSDSYVEQPCTDKQFKKQLKCILPSCKPPYYFTNKDGVQQVLSRNTLSCDRIKQGICDMIGLPSIIRLPSKETSFYSALNSLLKDTNVRIERHVYIAGYYADIEILGLEKQIIIEYDENGHRYYDQVKEKERERVLESLGYYIIRIDDSLDPISSASFIFKQLLKYGLLSQNGFEI